MAEERKPPSTSSVLWAEWRRGLKDIQDAVLNPWNGVTQKHEEPGAMRGSPASTPEAIAQAQPLARVRPRRKRNEDGEIPPMGLKRSGDRVAPDVSKTIR